ncbi:MAG: methyltransferase domain-containing protein [Nitrospirota bacterium]
MKMMDSPSLTRQYNSKAQWMGYWYQISEALEVSPDSVLVIGKGSGIIEDNIRHLSNEKTDVLTLDINYAVNSDIAGEVTSLPFGNDTFDVIICCQVLEHMPFEKFPLSLSELHRVAKKRVVLSCPHGRKHIKVTFSLPFSKEKQLVLKSPFTNKYHKGKQYYWEIGRGISQKQVAGQISRLFDIEKNYLNEISCDHRFFVLKRKNIWK